MSYWTAGLRTVDRTYHSIYIHSRTYLILTPPPPNPPIMGCCGDREKGVTVTEEQKWAYITLSDFKSTSCLAPFSYAWLWILVLISCAVYAADAFTAVNLLAFDKWTSQVKPVVPFEIAKWIFAITIIISYVFLIYRWIRALRVMRMGSVTECYLEPLAAILQSMRITKSGQGWRRFLVFAELTKSKKGANYIALFVYFQFKSALIIIVAQGPRIALNAMTLYAVMKAQIIPGGDHSAKDRSNFEQFFMNIKIMIDTGNKQEIVVYFTMLFSLVIWLDGDDDTSTVFSMQRSDTMNTTTTLPPYSSSNTPSYRSNTMNSTGRSLIQKPSLPTLDERPGMPIRSETGFSSYGSNAPMLSQAGNMGMSSPAPPMPPLDRNGPGYFGEQQYAPERSFTPMTQGRASPMPPRGPMPPVDTNYNNFQSEPQSNRPYQEFSPFNSRGPPMAQEYELSPVDMTPTENISQHYYGDSSPEDYQPPQMPSTLRTASGSPAPVGLPNQPRAGTAPPRAGVPPSLQSAIQRREASNPFPNRGMNASAPPQQQRSATAPIQQPGWAQGPPPRSFTPQGPPPRSFTPQGPPPRSFTPQGPPPRSFTPQGPPPRSFTPQGPGPQQRGYGPGAPRNFDNY
ncbi:pheromone-regulated membrane 6 [Pyrenophora seminiperda CCB06]|uniref:Pheromone-regulated membrane 6 n=1 Tax=Pyrenophora seminiperda CCB06 TaxID=1302712 RepID=A0A3M7M2L0_9PLEO|nr:pheromone-regulated membrane 6 [Pyrenophora seminiperda CCB06]